MKIRVDQLFSPWSPKKRRQLLSSAVLLSVAIAMWSLGYGALRQEKNTQRANSVAHEEASLETPSSLFDSFFATRSRIYDTIHAGESLSGTLSRLHFPKRDADKLINALSPTINVRNIRAGSVLMVEFSAENIQLHALTRATKSHDQMVPLALELFAKDEHGMAFSVKASFSESDIDVKINRANVYKEHTIISGVVSNSVYGAIVNSGGDAQLVNSFADIFGWQFDFFRDTREGDTYQMIVEKNVADGRFVGFGRVLAAEYTNNGKILRGYYFKSKDAQVSGYFDDQGQSLQNAFLKAPLKLAFISSPFNRRRFHPIQKIIKPHNGVDYGANLGTPFMAVAQGIVINAGYSPFNGNWVRLRHSNGYETEYLHANKLAKGIHLGVRVQQGQVIGYVGKTGLASGYHLHFGMKKNGGYVDPTQQRFARNAGIPERYTKEFKLNIAAMVIALNRQSPNKADVLAQR